MIKIPSQLANWRFILLPAQSKEPFEKDWSTIANYAYTDQKLLDHLRNGGNYGVLTGAYDGVDHVVLDVDDPELAQTIRDKLPPTFSVKTPSGGVHFYFTIRRDA